MRHFNRISLSLFFLLPSAASATVASRSFSDVPQGSVYFAATESLKQQGFIRGYDDGTFRPDATINRAEFVKIFTSAGIVSDTERADCMAMFEDVVTFPDVKRTDWFAPNVCVAQRKGIVGGYPDGSFHPERDIAFTEASKILGLLFKGPMDPLPEWYSSYVGWVGDNHAIPLTILSLDQKITRGEMAEIFYRITSGIRHKESKTLQDLEGNASSRSLRTAASPFFDMNTVQIDDIVGGMTARSIDIRYVVDGQNFGIIGFVGAITVTGDYEVKPLIEGPSPSDTVCFRNFDEDTLRVLPQAKNSQLDFRYFCLEEGDASLIREYFPAAGTGRATITIGAYTVPYIEAEAWATADLLSVASVDPR